MLHQNTFDDIGNWDSMNKVDLGIDFGISFEAGVFQEIKDIKTLIESLL